jgi:hypothetical protein
MAVAVRRHLSVEIGAPRPVVYAFRLDCMHLPELNSQVRQVRRVDGGTEAPGVGTRYHCEVDLARGSCVAAVDVVEAAAPSRIVLDMEAFAPGAPPTPGSGMRSVETAQLIELAEDRTRVEVELTVFVDDAVGAEALAGIEASAGEPTRIELAAMKRALEAGPGAPGLR